MSRLVSARLVLRLLLVVPLVGWLLLLLAPLLGLLLLAFLCHPLRFQLKAPFSI